MIVNQTVETRVVINNEGSQYRGKIGTMVNSRVTPAGLMYEIVFDQPVNGNASCLFFKTEISALDPNIEVIH